LIISIETAFKLNGAAVRLDSIDIFGYRLDTEWLYNEGSGCSELARKPALGGGKKPLLRGLPPAGSASDRLIAVRTIIPNAHF
jgi:hypothetical protein